MLDPYRSIDLYPGKCGVTSIIHGYLFKFKPWYYDGKTVWWGKEYELRSDAEDASFKLKNSIDTGVLV